MPETGLIYTVKPCPCCGGEGLDIDQIATGVAMRKRRLEAGIAATDVAHQMGRSAQYVHDLELGRRRWKVALAVAYLAALEVR